MKPRRTTQRRRRQSRRKKKTAPRRLVRKLVFVTLGMLLASGAGIFVWERFVLDLPGLSDRHAVRRLEVPGAEGLTRPLLLGPQNPLWTPIERVSESVVLCVVKAEDDRFWSHHGLDWIELRRSFEENLVEGRYARGGSTITMQLAKNLFLWRDKSLLRKALEAYLAVRLEQTLEKRRILELYLNAVEWGPGLYGIGEASRHYFGKPPSGLTLGEAALLAAILPNPRGWNPDRAPSIARERQQQLLGRLSREGLHTSL